MIVQMSRIYIAARRSDRDRLLKGLGRSGLLHLEPVEPEAAVAGDETVKALSDLDRAIEILSPLESLDVVLDQKPLEAAVEALEIQAAISKGRKRLTDLHRMAEGLSVWGRLKLEHLEALREAGLTVHFFAMSPDIVDSLEAECVERIVELPGKRVMVGVVDREGGFQPPEGAEAIPFPAQDLPSIQAEAAKIEADLKQGLSRLSELAGQLDGLKRERDRLSAEVERELAQRSGLSMGDLFALQGWVPSETAVGLESRLADEGLYAAIRIRDAGMDELPPTLIRYPRWARPIKGLFDILGTLPGYRELDLSPFFMVAIPIFAAMLIGDAGYGFLIALAGLLFYRRLIPVAGKQKAQLLVIFGLVALVWGMLSANYFGITPETLAGSGGFFRSEGPGAGADYGALRSSETVYGIAARLMWGVAPLWREDPVQARFLLMKISLIIGCLHLILGRLRRLIELLPRQQALAEIGWITALGDMLALIWYLLFIGADQVPAHLWWILLAAVSLPAWFGRPIGRPGKRILLGFASSLLPLLSTFSDTMSYIRLFAVGLASYYIASAFNLLGTKVAETATWFAAVPILIFGHSLNIGLAAIAVFAHGVRLNMLEFSNHAGVQWGGYAYRPFTLFKGSGSTGENV